MADRAKEAQRAELHKTIWRIANDLRGSVDGWDQEPADRRSTA
jgi:type I restriction enzyme M protein